MPNSATERVLPNRGNHLTKHVAQTMHLKLSDDPSHISCRNNNPGCETKNTDKKILSLATASSCF